MSAADEFPAFNQPLKSNGYIWWYVDAVSDDERCGLTIIAFVGSVFSPYYARARRRGPSDPEHYCALNVALYGAGGKRWALTERGGAQLGRDADTLSIGPSALRWTGSALTIDINEVTVPLPSRLRGRVTVIPQALTGHTTALDSKGCHRWSPVAPVSRIEVEFSHPARRWRGNAYLDSNCGDDALESSFARWDWSRTTLHDGASVLYDVSQLDDSRRLLALRIDRRGNVEPFEAPAPMRLPATRVWRIERATHSQSAEKTSVIDTLEDTPFYARSLLRSQLFGQEVTAVHESLSLHRFQRTWVQTLLPFRMPRRAPSTR